MTTTTPDPWGAEDDPGGSPLACTCDTDPLSHCPDHDQSSEPPPPAGPPALPTSPGECETPEDLLDLIRRDIAAETPRSNGYYSNGTANKLFGELVRTGVVKRPVDYGDTVEVVRPTAEGRIVTPDRSPVLKRPRKAFEGVPRTGLTTRKPRDQNEYMLAVNNSHRLPAGAKHACLVAAIEIGLEAFKRGGSKDFGGTSRELTPEYVAGKILPDADQSWSGVPE